MKRVLFISYFFPPAGGAGVQRTARFAKYLRDFGYEPIVLAPEETTYRRDPLSFGVDESFLSELPKDLCIYRVPACQPFGLLRLLKKLKLLWIFHFFVRPDEKLTWSFAAIAKGLQLLRREKIDLIYQNVGPWSTSLVGYVLKRVSGKPWVLDIRDPWTQWAMGVWPSRLHYIVERAAEGRILSATDRISTLGETYRAELLQLHPSLDAEKVVAIPNGYDLTGMPRWEEMIGRKRNDEKMLIVHAGKFYDTWGSARRDRLSAVLKTAYDATLGRLRYSPRQIDSSIAGPRHLLQAVASLKAKDARAAKNISVEFIGRTHPSVRKQIEQLELQDTVRLRGQLPHDICLRRLFEADLLFLPLFRFANGRPMGVLPLKLYEYMVTGNPILAAVPEGDLKRILARAGTGIFVRADDPQDMCAALLRLYAEHSSGGIQVQPDWEYIKQYDRKELTHRLADLFDSVLRSAGKHACRE